jgi:hypothetical protein
MTHTAVVDHWPKKRFFLLPPCPLFNIDFTDIFSLGSDLLAHSRTP